MAEDQLSATDLLLRAGAGEASAVESMFPLVYDELRRIAHLRLARESTGRTLGTTELVHEAYLRLIDQTRVQRTGRAHFMAIAATAMRRIFVDRARSRRSLKRGGADPPFPSRPWTSAPTSGRTCSWRWTKRWIACAISTRGRHAWWSVASSAG